MEGWNKIIEVEDLVKANVINAALHEVNIDTALINRKDSALVFLGRYDIFVKEADVKKATALIRDIEDLDYDPESEE